MNRMQEQHEWFMRLAIAEAKKGVGRTAPNPAVGAVVVQNGRVVGKGYHHRAGTPHAEIHALADAGEAAQGATLYVTLEPCNHTGRTPPCTQAILAAKITRVVIGMMDPNPHVVGGGAGYLQQNGVEVLCGVLEQDCHHFNRPFLKHSRTGLPWIICKAGLSLDGRISYTKGQGGAITGPQAHDRVHGLRNEVDAILVGVETIRVDNPSLTTRLPDAGKARDPLRIVLDTHLRISADAQILTQDSSAETWIICSTNAPQERQQRLEAMAQVRVIALPQGSDGRIDIKQLLLFLGSHNITAVLVEGGGQIHGSFYKHQLIDEVFLFYAPFFIGDAGAPCVKGIELLTPDKRPDFINMTVEPCGSDILIHALVTYPA